MSHIERWAKRVRAAAATRPHADIALAVVLWAVVLLTNSAGGGGAPLSLSAVAVSAVACGGLALRSSWPVAALVISSAAAEIYLSHSQGQRGEIVLAAPLIAVYTVAETSRRRRALIISCLAVLTIGAVHLWVRPGVIPGAENVALAALGAVAVAAGDAARNRRAYLAEAQARADQAEADRDAQAARQVTEERLRIARDLHDALGHHLALISIQSAVAARALHEEPEAAAEALDHVRSASRTALAELSETIGVLRQPGEQWPLNEPVVGLGDVDRLLDSFRRSGLAVTVRVEGGARPLPVATDLAAYRVVQEAVTNVAKHAGSVPATLTLTYRADQIRIRIDNAPPYGQRRSVGVESSGRGLIGMRERVTAMGGTFIAGPRHDGGFRVTAALPINGNLV